MADHGIFIGWSDVVAGRERQAEKVFGEAIAFFTTNGSSLSGPLFAAHGA